MNSKLFIQAITKFLIGVGIVGLLVFLPAGTIKFLQGWLFMIVLFVPMFCAGIVMMIKNPELLMKRLNAKEKQNEQKFVLLFSSLMFIAAFLIAGFNYRFGWIILPYWVSYVGVAFFLVSYLLYAEVLRENTYLSRTIEVEENQKVIDTGLYSVVRHPMYMATLVLFISMGFILGSLISVGILLLYIPIIVLRIKNEEKLLEKELNGYLDYKKKVKYRLIPFIW